MTVSRNDVTGVSMLLGMTHLTTLAALAVLAVLIAGIWNMGRPGASPSLSQNLMRWRVGLQFLAVAVAMLTLYLARGGFH